MTRARSLRWLLAIAVSMAASVPSRAQSDLDSKKACAQTSEEAQQLRT
jgi:hypothetical protein